MYRIFISYSRTDVQFIRPIIDLMRTTGVAIFRDEDSIPPGKRWRPVIAKSIEEAETLIVFWCVHSKQSNEVKKEWNQAVKLEKDIIPVLLDETPLSPPLGEYNGIDFRIFSTGHNIEEESPDVEVVIEADEETQYYDDGWGGYSDTWRHYKKESPIGETWSVSSEVFETNKKMAAQILQKVIEHTLT